MFLFLKRALPFALFTVCLFSLLSCKNQTEYSQVKKQILDLHDKVMASSEKAESNEMQFSALLKSGLKQLKLKQPALDTGSALSEILLLNDNLHRADDQMEDWMHTYNNNFKGRSDRETLGYFTAGRLKIVKLDSMYKIYLQRSDDYLKHLNIKPAAAAAKMNM